MKHYVGIEIGGTKQQAASFDEEGRPLDIRSVRLKQPFCAQDVLDWLAETIPELIDKDTLGIGVGFGGILDTATGSSACSVQVSGWQGFPIRTWFEERFHLPVVVVNDTVCGGYAEYHLGAGHGAHMLFYTNIGTGCGGAMYKDGLNFDGVGTGCAYHGQLYVPGWDNHGAVRMESVCRGPAIESRLRTPGYVPDDSLLMDMCHGDVSLLGCREWIAAARANDSFACRDVDKWASRYAVALADILAALAPERIVIGGGVMNGADVLLTPIRYHTDKLCFISMKDRYEIVACETGDMAVLIGAALYARDGFIRI